jgi:hypothetical protein
MRRLQNKGTEIIKRNKHRTVQANNSYAVQSLIACNFSEDPERTRDHIGSARKDYCKLNNQRMAPERL